MLSVDTFLAVGIFMGKIAAIVLIPVFYVWIGGVAYAWLRERERVATIAVAPLTHLGGVVVGITLLRFSPHGDVYDVDYVFGESGPWNIDFVSFLMHRASPWAYPWDTLYSVVLSGPLEWMRQVAVMVYAVLGGVLPPRSFRVLAPEFETQVLQRANLALRRRVASLKVFGGSTAMLRGVLVFLGAMLWSAYLFIYAVNVIYWSLHSLNFWAFLLLVFIYQKYRHSRR